MHPVTAILCAGWGTCGSLAAGALAFVLTSWREQRYRALRRAIALFLPVLVILTAALGFDYPGRTWVTGTIVIVLLVTLATLLLPVSAPARLRIIGPLQRIDERDAIFHRFYRLQPGMPEYNEYYRRHPEKKAFDDQLRALPQMGRPGTRSYAPLSSPFLAATFEVLENLTRDVDWSPAPIEPQAVQASPDEFTRRIKGFARYLGAAAVGTTRLNPAYVYSHIGRSPGTWGEPIELDHSHAIAIAVEMRHEMIRHAPGGPVITETAFQYFEAAKIATQVARYINLLGYEARAHVDGNYRVLCVPIAVDAGLGELGRLGLLMTPRFGPRIRLAIVTTSLPLLQDPPLHFGVQDFCRICRKCATCCPSASIAATEQQVHNGVEKWQSNQESCYHFWRIQGTDCCVCINVCPYSHPATPLHNLVRWAVRRNHLARRLALWGDDFFYGRRPSERYPRPAWH